jgi:hypothetical protein
MRLCSYCRYKLDNLLQKSFSSENTYTIHTVLNSFFLQRIWTEVSYLISFMSELSRLLTSTCSAPILKLRDIFQSDSSMYLETQWDIADFCTESANISTPRLNRIFSTNDFFITTEELQIFVIIYKENTYTIIHTENFFSVLIVLQFVWK